MAGDRSVSREGKEGRLKRCDTLLLDREAADRGVGHPLAVTRDYARSVPAQGNASLWFEVKGAPRAAVLASRQTRAAARAHDIILLNESAA